MDKKDKDNKPEVDWETDTILALVYIPPYIHESFLYWLINLWVSCLITARFAPKGKSIKGAVLKNSQQTALVIYVPDGGPIGLLPDRSTLPPPAMVEHRDPFQIKD